MPDAVALAALHAECFTLPRPWSADEICAVLTSRHAFLLAESDGFLIGRVIADEAEVLTLAVRGSQRRQGIGQRLVGSFLTTARSRGAASAFLEVAASNAPAIALYLQAGFTPAGRRKGYYMGVNGQKDDALILSRHLEDAG